MPFVLDTDHLTILLRQGEPASDRLLRRLGDLPPDDVATTVVSFQEQIVGWLGYLNRARSDADILRAYGEFDSILRWFSRMNVLPFDEPVLARFKSIRQQCRRVGTLDLRIASIALTTNATLLSRNLRDFRQVPELRIEDWTS